MGGGLPGVLLAPSTLGRRVDEELFTHSHTKTKTNMLLLFPSFHVSMRLVAERAVLHGEPT